jgi:hypothetical protein
LWMREQSSPSLEMKHIRDREHSEAILDLHLPVANVRVVDKSPRTRHSPRSNGEVTEVEHDHEHQNHRYN